MILVSACLLGLNTRYDGGSHAHELLMSYSSLGQYIPVCPEQLGGLATPRRPAEIQKQGNTLICLDDQGRDVTKEFYQGAREVLKIAQMAPIRGAILKERSPSCGVHYRYDGSFKHQPMEGQGLTSALLSSHGIPVFSDEELTEEILKGLLFKEID